MKILLAKVLVRYEKFCSMKFGGFYLIRRI